MNSSFDTGLNRTGIATSPVHSGQMIEGSQSDGTSYPEEARRMALIRQEYAREAEPVGKMPPPATVKGAVQAAVHALKGEKANVFIDKLGERLAFERAGTRLYELAISKAEVFPSWQNGPTVQDLIEIRNDELTHFGLLARCMAQIGADPTAMSPSANLSMNISKGLPAVLSDPRIDLRESLEALLVAELSDNACWESLIVLAKEAGQDEMAAQFEQALRSEEKHLNRIQSWLRHGIAAAWEREEQPRPVAEPPSNP
jgi:hypothetical protein